MVQNLLRVTVVASVIVTLGKLAVQRVAVPSQEFVSIMVCTIKRAIPSLLATVVISAYVEAVRFIVQLISVNGSAIPDGCHSFAT
jgi:hypothetical protein